MGDTPRPPTISTTLHRIAQQAMQYPTMVCTTLAHLMDVDWLREADRRPRKDAAPGIDGVTAAASAEHLEAHLTDLYKRLRSGRYTAPPVKRTWLDQEDGSQRHAPLQAQYRTWCQKLRGHYQYYGIRGIYPRLERVYEQAEHAWRYWLSRRNHKSAIPWEKFDRLH